MQNAKEEYKVEPRSQLMGSLHYFLFVIAVIFAFIIILVFADATEPMLIYDESEIYSCPKDWITELQGLNNLAENDRLKSQMFNQPSDKKFDVQPFTGYIDEDMFYNPMKCKPLYQDSAEPVWLDRVEIM